MRTKWVRVEKTGQVLAFETEEHGWVVKLDDLTLQGDTDEVEEKTLLPRFIREQCTDERFRVHGQSVTENGRGCKLTHHRSGRSAFSDDPEVYHINLVRAARLLVDELASSYHKSTSEVLRGEW